MGQQGRNSGASRQPPEAVGLADRWADLAVAAWSTEWNFGPGYDTIVYDAYGVRPDDERISYYRLLWDLA